MTTPPEREFDRLKLIRELKRWEVIMLVNYLAKGLSDEELSKIIEIIKN